MRLRDLEIYVVEPPSPGWGGRYWIFVRLITDDGIAGYGEVYASSIGPAAMRAVIEDVFERHMLGENPQNIELMFRRAYSSGFSQRPDPTVIGAFSGLEIACWDIVGKAHDCPVHALLGGVVNDRIRSYSYLYPEPFDDEDKFWSDADRSAEVAARMVEQGFTAVKFDPAGPYSVLPAPPGSADGWRNSILSGSRNRFPRTIRKQWQGWPGRCESRLLPVRG